MEESRTERLRKINFWETLFELRDKDRKNKENALSVIPGAELPWETNRQGIMRWYLHPIMEDTVVNPYMIYVQQIPPGSRSGQVKSQGSQIFYIWKGKGHTVLNEAKYSWETGTVIQIPLRPLGVVYQHFNDDGNNPVWLISVEANTVGALGMDRGSGFEQLQNCPEYDAL